MPDFYEKLNEAQRRALCHYKGPAIVLAGPGSGKTTVLTGRVKHLIEQHHIPPATILVITYTKAAALSMRQRFIREMNGQVQPVNFGTFHAIFFHILKEQYHLKQDSLMSLEDKLHLLLPILKEYGKERDNQKETAVDILHSISLYKNGLALEKIKLPPDMSETDFENLYRDYCRKAFQAGKMDFDDMILRCFSLFKERPEVCEKWQEKFRFILVDEFQDCNIPQYRILQLLAKKHGNLFVVGDDDQAIYGFRGASPGIMQQFLTDYPGAEQIFLEANYRSRQEIVHAANLVIGENKKRFTKRIYAAGVHGSASVPVSIHAFSDKREQFAYLTEKICVLAKNLSFGEMAVICRTNGEIAYLMSYLKKKNIPFCVKEQLKNRYRHFIVQDILAYFLLASGNTDRQLFLQVLHKPQKGISRDIFWKKETDIGQLITKLADSGKEKEAIKLRTWKGQLEQMGAFSPYLAIRYIRNVIGYDRYLLEKAGGDEGLIEEWKELLDELMEEAKDFLNLRDWILYVKEEENRPDERQEGYGVQLMTLHASKGLEFSYVCILNVNEGRIPYGKMPDEEREEEERRLFYVGMTRTKETLDILYLTGTVEHPRFPSRFLKPLLKDYSSSTSSSNS